MYQSKDRLTGPIKKSAMTLMSFNYTVILRISCNFLKKAKMHLTCFYFMAGSVNFVSSRLKFILCWLNQSSWATYKKYQFHTLLILCLHFYIISFLPEFLYHERVRLWCSDADKTMKRFHFKSVPFTLIYAPKI